MTVPLNVAGAPISWGVCEVPGWGHQLDADRVLAEMAALGLPATELGPDGFLPVDRVARAEVLKRHGLRAVGGFLPVVLHEPAHDPVPEVARALSAFGPGMVLVLAGATGSDGYETRPELDDAAWKTLLGNLDRLVDLAAAHTVTATLHPHVGTVIENEHHVHRVLDGSIIPLTLDTGHLLIGGTDPMELTRQALDRIAHTHLKDVDGSLAARVRTGEIGYAAAVSAGLYRPLGTGEVDIAGIVGALRAARYDGWYVLEQDTVLTGPDGDPAADVRACLAFLHGLA
jgi:inosose dehydratase